ncbi:MAG: DUF1223 domain-containing protein [Halofilum sp. (in: g-proteobacteria)]|nr:DUF1223 domain-containing protein [Halofilum sp. (in: g-proteobacteria)]
MRYRFALLLLVAFATLSVADTRHTARPVVVELFTSQGCSSCPPADALLGQLAERDSIIALSLHVDYWNRLGWTDPFAQARFSDRQRSYAEQLEDDNPYTTGVYTPQIVVDGRYAVVGHVAGRVRDAIERAGNQAAWLRPRIVGDPAEHVHLPAAGQAVPGQPATVWLITYDDRHTTAIDGGENDGRELTNHHVVRGMRRIGTWHGEEARLALGLADTELADHDGVVVLVQLGRAGNIIGAAEHRLGNVHARR